MWGFNTMKTLYKIRLLRESLFMFFFVFTGIRLFDLGVFLHVASMDTFDSDLKFKLVMLAMIVLILSVFSIIFIYEGYLSAKIRDLEEKIDPRN